MPSPHLCHRSIPMKNGTSIGTLYVLIVGKSHLGRDACQKCSYALVCARPKIKCVDFLLFLC